ncbi:hypothetical protein AK88_01601 [Plasmodium fragile]|uniref:POTRA domain-containing protein n=1 Tax=Plasmodium fragile TaxID=5857 RepID=A0A0D9QNR1_PLAFR|nr:uncharacterized protein AK88_01601 [Plasmodium fragile]KJP88720.1 hypothetical protein AK88_01601 [Plasmodium fragile]
MKNVARLCVCLFLLAHWATVLCRRVHEKAARDNYIGGAILSSGLSSGLRSDLGSNLPSRPPIHDKHSPSHYTRRRKTNNKRNLLFLKNKLKEIWDKFATKGNYFFNKPSKEKHSSFNLKKVLQNLTPKGQNEIISRVVVRNSTVISPTLLANLLIRENVRTIRHKDIERVVKIVSDFYTKNNYLFSRVLRHEIVKDGDQDVLTIYVEELILGPGCVQIRVFRRAKPTGGTPTTATGKPTATQVDRPTSSAENTLATTSHTTSENTSETTSHTTSENTSETTSQTTSEATSETTAENTSDTTVETAVDTTAENISHTTVETAVDTTAENTPTDTPPDDPPQEELLFERKGSASGAPSPDDLQTPQPASNKLRKLFEKKMNIKEGSIFVWDQATFDLLLKSNLFNYIHVKLLHDKQEKKHILQIDLVENKRVSFIPSISKSFNSLLDLCMNITFGYLHSFNYGDKFKLKFFKNLSYKNHKHDYDMVFVNDIVELEKLRNNSHSYFIFGVNVKQAFKKELDSSALNECINIMNRQGENGGKKDSENVQAGNVNNSGEQNVGQHDLLPRSSSAQRKNIYSYLHKGKIFLFAIRKIRNTVLEIKMKATKELFHNFLYFLERKNEPSAGGAATHSGRLFPLRFLPFLPFWRSPNDSQVLSNQLYNIYGSKLKLSSCLNAYSASWFEKAKCMKAFFNVKNKVDLVFYFNTDRKFRLTEHLAGEENKTHDEGNSLGGGTDGSKADVKSIMLSFFEDANKKGGFLSLDKIKNVYLNYTFYFQKNFKINIFDLCCKVKKVFTYLGKRSRQAVRHLATGEQEPPLVLVPLVYKCKLIMNQVHLLLNVAFFFKRCLWDLRHGYNCPSIGGWVGGERNGEKGPWSYYHQVKEFFLENSAPTRKRDGPNFEEDLKQIILPSGDTSTGSSPTNSTTYNICSVNLNDAQKEQHNKFNLTMNYKLIFPVLFENYFLNLMDLRLYLFLNCSLFGIQGSSTSSSTAGSTHGGMSGEAPNAMSEDSRKSALYNYLKLSFLKNKRKMHHSAFGLGLLLSNINIFLNFQTGRRFLLPSLVLQLDEGTSRFGYLS